MLAGRARCRYPVCLRHAIGPATGIDPMDGSGPAAGTGHMIPVQVRSFIVRFTGYSFGFIRVDGVTYDHDLIIDRGKIRKRKKAASRKFRGGYGHTPLSVAEDIPWRCRRLVIGTRRRRRAAVFRVCPDRRLYIARFGGRVRL